MTTDRDEPLVRAGLVEQLRLMAADPWPDAWHRETAKEAADEIERLRARVAELEEELQRIRNCWQKGVSGILTDQGDVPVPALDDPTSMAALEALVTRLRARVAELEQERNEARSLLSTVNSSDYSLGLLVRELRARVAELEKDAARLAALECLVDVIGGIDIHEEAAINASAFGRDEPNKDDYLAAIRTAIDAAMRED